MRNKKNSEKKNKGMYLIQWYIKMYYKVIIIKIFYTREEIVEQTRIEWSEINPNTYVDLMCKKGRWVKYMWGKKEGRYINK